MKLKSQKCGHECNYTGEHKRYAQCTNGNSRTSVSINKESSANTEFRK